MQVTNLRPLPLMVRAQSLRSADPNGVVIDYYLGDLAVAYEQGPPYRGRLLSWADLGHLGWSQQTLRRMAVDTLNGRLDAMRLHGEPPAFMLSFDGLESSLLLIDAIWEDLGRVVPGEVVVGVPARDAVIVTGSQSAAGLERVRRAVNRTLCARPQYPLSAELFIRRGRYWEVLRTNPGVRQAS